MQTQKRTPIQGGAKSRFAGGGSSVHGQSGASLRDTQNYCPRCAASLDNQQCACGWRRGNSTRKILVAAVSIVLTGMSLLGATQVHQWFPDKDGAAKHIVAGKAYVEQEKFEQALKEFNQAVSLDPTCAQAHYQLSKALDDNGQSNQALVEMQAAIKLAPNDPSINDRYVALLEDFGRYDEAVVPVERLLAMRPHDAAQKRQASWLYERLGDNKKALRLLQEAVQTAPKEEKNWCDLAGLLSDIGRKSESIAVLKQGIKAVPDGESLYYALGSLLSAGKHPAEAIEPLKKAVALDDQDEDAAMLLERVTKGAGKPVYLVKLKKSGLSFIAEVVINEKVHANLIVDSGATDVLVSNKVACKLGCNLSAAPIVEIGSATGQGRGHTVSLNSIRIGNATVSNIKAVVYDSPSQDGEEGLLGMTFLSHFKFALDADHAQLWLYNR